MCVLLNKILAKNLISRKLKIKNVSVSERVWKSSCAEATSHEGLAQELIKLSYGITRVLYSSQNML